MGSVFAKTLVREREKRTFEVAAVPNVGWQASERSDQDLISQCQCSDWHRVERVLSRFTREISELRRQGWMDA
ncbi:MAG TPA: hypothetical protein VH583_19860 [Vicinamibacterales bacterium]|jgi:hypothetical protein